MNVFGLFFSFFIPGVAVGMMAMAAFYHSAKEKRHAATRRSK